MNKQNGITLIALVITIIVLLILAGISIASLTGENGILKKGMKAKEETEIKGYHERIELVRTELRLEKENYVPPTIAEMQKELDENQTEWVASTEIKLVDGIETLELKTKEGYIFHITETGTEYKGKGEVVDTSALKREDALKLEIVGEGNNGGKLVQITDLSGVDYYKIEYTIGDREGNWLPIESRNTVEVGPSLTIYARLVYETNKGVIVSLSIEATEPTVIAKDTDMSQVVRKTQIPLVDLFEITWGSDGIGTVEYSVSGNLNFKNTSFSSTEISNVSELEIGNYEVTCKVTSPSNKVQTATKQNVKVTRLANTTVANASNSQVAANAIYSEYDLAYFRDLVNGGQFTINAKLMNDIDMTNICSDKIGNWKPIADYLDLNIAYNGTFDGNRKHIDKMYINNTLGIQGLFGKNIGIIKNLTLSEANIKSYHTIGGIVGINSGRIEDCKNTANIEGSYIVGGIVGYNKEGGNIENCYNTGNITTIGKQEEDSYSYTGGIAGANSQIGDNTISRCYNTGNVVASYPIIGGICGSNGNNSVYFCYNKGNIMGLKEGSVIGGIVGWNHNGGIVEGGYNEGTIQTAGTFLGEERNLIGGIVGSNSSTGSNIIRNCYNKGKIIGNYSQVGGIVGYSGSNTNKTSNTYNIGAINGSTETGGIIGRNSESNTSNNYYKKQLVTVGGVIQDVGIGIGTMIGSVGKEEEFFKSDINNNTSLIYLLREESPTDTWLRNDNINDGYPYLNVLLESYN